jgi:hypothetical protein
MWRTVKSFSAHMIARIYASRNAFLVAGIAAVLSFLTLLWIGKAGDRVHARDRKDSLPEKRVASAPPPQASKTQSVPASLPAVENWTPAPIEFVKLTAGVTLYNSRGKEVKQFSVGKRLRVNKRAGDKITIDYLGDEYTISTASTEPSQ